VYLPLEVFTREYLGKLSLAMNLVENEEEVIIGYNHLVRSHALESEKPAVYYEIKGKSKKEMGHLAKLREKEICLVGQDEEAGISYLNFSDFEVLRPEVNGTKPFEAFFAWGEEDFAAYNKELQLESVLQTGSPRTVHWGSNGTNFYAEQIDSIQNEFGEFVLLVSNLGSRNNIWTEKEMKKYARNSGYEFSYDEAAKDRMRWEEDAFDATLKIIDAIIESTQKQIVLRPHPNENSTVWNSIFENNPRISIVKSGDSVPYIMAAKQVIHAGSTVGLESLLCGTSTISFQNLIGAENVPMTSNVFSKNLGSINELTTFLNNDDKFIPRMEFYDLAKKKMTTFNDSRVLAQQAQVINAVKFDKKIVIQPEIMSRSDALKKSRLYQRLKYGKSSYLEIHRNKRPVIDIKKITTDANKILDQFKSSYQVQIRELGESTFSIRRCG
jgi:surface carbohydrate biosynthesis protein